MPLIETWTVSCDDCGILLPIQEKKAQPAADAARLAGWLDRHPAYYCCDCRRTVEDIERKARARAARRPDA